MERWGAAKGSSASWVARLELGAQKLTCSGSKGVLQRDFQETDLPFFDKVPIPERRQADCKMPIFAGNKGPDLKAL